MEGAIHALAVMWLGRSWHTSHIKANEAPHWGEDAGWDQTSVGWVHSGKPHVEGKLGWIHACQSETSSNETEFSLRGLVTQDESMVAASFHMVPVKPHFAGCTSQNPELPILLQSDTCHNSLNLSIHPDMHWIFMPKISCHAGFFISKRIKVVLHNAAQFWICKILQSI